MRADMFKVAVERPRWASRFADSPKLKRTDRSVKQIGHKRHAFESSRIGKTLNENLAPLRRYLMKQRGRQWNDVFSEICEHLDTGSTVKMHIREHIEDFIVVKVHISADGQWLGERKYRGLVPLDKDRWSWPDLYVDPFDGRIKETDQLRRKLGIGRGRRTALRLSRWPLGPHEDFRRLSPKEALLQREGLWFAVVLNRDPNCCDDALRHDLLQGDWREHDHYQVTSLKQLSKKELQAHQVQNTPAP